MLCCFLSFGVRVRSVLLACPFSLSGVCLGSKDVEKWNRTEFGNYGAKRSNQYPILRRLVATGNSCKWLNSSIYKKKHMCRSYSIL